MTQFINSARWQSRPTWKWERDFAILFVTIITVIGVVADYQGPRIMAAEFFCALGVIYTFAHMQVGSRLEEAQGRDDSPTTVECAAKLTKYLIRKEIYWLLGFSLHGAWSATGGIPLFLFYPAWRRWYLNARAVPRRW